MAYRVPKDRVVVAAAQRVLRAANSIVSQKEFSAQVIRELRREDSSYSVGGERVRRLVSVEPFCRIELHARKGSKEKILNRCPVCGSRLERLKNQTLFGGEVTLTLRCPACKYWTGKEKRIPTLYVFHYAGAPSAAGVTAPELVGYKDA